MTFTGSLSVAVAVPVPVPVPVCYCRLKSHVRQLHHALADYRQRRLVSSSGSSAWEEEALARDVEQVRDRVKLSMKRMRTP